MRSLIQTSQKLNVNILYRDFFPFLLNKMIGHKPKTTNDRVKKITFIER